MTLTREGDFIGSEDDTVEEINIFDGQDNRITFEQVGTNQALDSILRLQVYTKTFKCTYQLQLYPFDTQVYHQNNMEFLVLRFWFAFYGDNCSKNAKQYVSHSGVYCQPDRSQVGDLGDGDHPQHPQHGLPDCLDPIHHHQLVLC